MLKVYLNRDEEGWDWCLDHGDGDTGCLPVPYDAESDEYDISSTALAAALEADGYDLSVEHWFYIDGDYGPVGEWNRPEGV